MAPLASPFGLATSGIYCSRFAFSKRACTHLFVHCASVYILPPSAAGSPTRGRREAGGEGGAFARRGPPGGDHQQRQGSLRWDPGGLAESALSGAQGETTNSYV